MENVSYSKSMVVVAVVLLLICLPGKILGLEVKIGAIFSNNTNSKTNEELMTFNAAVDFINSKEIHRERFMFTLVKQIEFGGEQDDLGNINKAIHLVDHGSTAIIGPTNTDNVNSIQQICPQLQTPQIVPMVSGLSIYNPCNHDYLMRMSPGDELLFHAVTDVINHYSWTQISVLASRDNEGRSGIISFMKYLQQEKIKVAKTRYFHVQPDVITASLKRVLTSIKEEEARIIVLKCSMQYVKVVMNKATEMNMVHKWVWLLVNNQFDESHLMTKGGVKGLQGTIGVRQSIGQGTYSTTFNNYLKDNGLPLPTKPSSGRFIDSVLLLAEAIRSALKDGIQISSKQTHRICNNTNVTSGDQGLILSKYLKKIRIQGYMDKIALNELGSTTSGFYDIVNLYNNQITKVGQWSSYDKLVMFKDKIPKWGTAGSSEVPLDSVNVLANKTLTIVTVQSNPFIIARDSNMTEIQGPEAFQGIIIDMFNILKKRLHFDYVIYVSPDRMVGRRDSSGKWVGAIGEVIEKKADLAIGPITITSHRSKVVDFTHSFMTTGLGVVMATNEVNPTYFGFLKPFHMELWLMIVGSVIGMAVVNWLFSMLSPNGYFGRCEHGIKSEVKPSYLQMKNNLSLSNSLWSSAAYYIGQGPDGLHPVSASGRVSIAVWWFCITILASTYTANLAAYLTTNRMQLPISTVQDLSQQNKVDYGLIAGSQTQKFFEDSQVPRYQIMWEYMKLRRALVADSSAGIKRVLEGNYAFIHDAPLLQYITRSKYCGQMKLLGGIDHGTIGQMNYGFALRKKSPYKKLINQELLKMQQSGEIKRLIKKWMIDKTPCLPLDDEKNKNAQMTDASKMGVINMLGVFILMGLGVVVGFLLLIIEWFTAGLGEYSTSGTPLCQSLCNRLKRLINHIRHSQIVILDKTTDVPFTANKTVQTDSHLSLDKNAHSYLSKTRRNDSQSQPSHSTHDTRGEFATQRETRLEEFLSRRKGKDVARNKSQEHKGKGLNRPENQPLFSTPKSHVKRPGSKI